MKLSTINLIVEGILADASSPSDKQRLIPIANEATIYLKTALICELQGIDKAMAYFKGDHSMNEYQEFRTGMILPSDSKKFNGGSSSYGK